MSDIDFDELDAAVASVLNKDEAPVAVPVAQPAPQASPVPVTATPPSDAGAPKTPAVTAGDLHKPAPVAPRGRFLDMVHPSGDMARPSNVPDLSSPVRPVVAQSGSPVFATEPVIAPTVAAPQPVTPALVQAPVPVVPAQPTPPASVNPVTGTSNQSSAAEPAHDPIDFFAASPDDSAPHQAPDIPAVASPFIPDAKVEKRPLGGAGATPVFTPTPLSASFTSPVDTVHAELTKIESESNIVTEPSPEQITESEPATTAPDVPAAENTTADPAPKDHINHAIQPLNTVEAPAFFTHKTPAPTEPDKPKGGKGTLIWVTVAVAILLIGFGVGASLYFTVLR